MDHHAEGVSENEEDHVTRGAKLPQINFNTGRKKHELCKPTLRRSDSDILHNRNKTRKNNGSKVNDYHYYG